MSSSLLTKALNWNKYGVVYGSAGVANTSIVVVRDDLIHNFQNTLNTWGIYMFGLLLNW
jgi:phosphoserine aminotransferase